MIGADQLAAMKPTAFLLNTARGALVDEAALLAALDTGAIRGAALDVLRDEPPSPDRPLLRHPRTLVTPHVAFSSATAIEEVARRAAGHVADALAGRVPPHVVNPEVLASPRLRLQTSPS
jgi:phosphoglycerate dehydrogenase-like enzyme